jgi:hypothetical protein
MTTGPPQTSASCCLELTHFVRRDDLNELGYFCSRLSSDAMSLEEIPSDFKPASIGKRAIVIDKIRSIVPSANFSNPSWGTIDGEGWSIEINICPEGECSGFAFHVRGGDAAVAVVAAILNHLKLRAIDSQTGDFFIAGPKAIDAFSRWRAYRDQVIASKDNVG